MQSRIDLNNPLIVAVEAARFIAERGVIEKGTPVLVQFITQVAARFGAVVTQKVAAQALSD